MSVLRRYWTSRFDQWGSRPEQRPGYTLLVPVPGDLPVFLELALQVLGTQGARGRVETLVIPDVVTPAMDAVVARHQADWAGPLELLRLPYPERVLLPRMRNPARNHGVQLLTGVSRTRARYIVLHDADLFLLSPDLLDERVALADREDLDVLGVDPVWDGWFAERGVHLAATWEMIARTDWLRSFPPSMHIGHDGEYDGEKHTFDTCLHPQAVSDPARREVVRSDDVVHFNYVISTYRHFQRARGGFVDDQFRLLLIRLFVDIFAREEFDYGLPSLSELAEGLHDAQAPVTYPAADGTVRESYAGFRGKLDRILQGPWTPPASRSAVSEQLQAFDRYYA
ncbi:glycosyltransferase family 2 protein [Ornithinimicrobium pratense]|uniref:Glycosyltransferase family 2 protein n=1 Tax=Ornithinimicrobium pratense TaxID=2593973 RepID=A0A5J6V9Q6_9MICO|nr:glycosyltransferase family 2 protein [Ornithinimicrobium pratense]QFG69772.1 glycosyltransferase family 2 protein [Ornithinimicrobium pratense]